MPKITVSTTNSVAILRINKAQFGAAVWLKGIKIVSKLHGQDEHDQHHDIYVADVRPHDRKSPPGRPPARLNPDLALGLGLESLIPTDA
jgi:hypothetical protein